MRQSAHEGVYMETRKAHAFRPLAGCAAAVAILLTAAGCATKPAVQPVHYFFPPAPDEPRIQFLTSFGKESDLGSQNSFLKFLVGSDQMIQRPLWKPYGITTSRGKIYVCDTMALNLTVVDIAKRRFRYMKPAGEAALVMPIGVAVDKDGTRYITDTKRGQILMYNDEGGFLGAIGNRGELKPCGIALTEDRIYFTDLAGLCVRMYDKKTRTSLGIIPPDHSNEKARLYSPTNLDIDDQGLLYVSDTGGFTMQVYDADGAYVRGVGELGLKPGSFALPKGIGVDRQGLTYVVDAATAVVQIFDRDGQLLMHFGYPGTSGPAALYLPAGLHIDYENVDLFQKFVAPGQKIEYLIFVTNQAGPNKVSVFGFLKKS